MPVLNGHSDIEPEELDHLVDAFESILRRMEFHDIMVMEAAR